MPDLHLSREELTAWRDDGAGDRDRIVAHLAACAGCRAIAAGVERSRPAEIAPSPFDAREFAARGYRAGAGAAVPQRTSSWRWLAAAAAVIVAVALIPIWVNWPDDTSGTMRGATSGLVPVLPVDVVVAIDELTFEWTGTSPNERVTITVVDLDRPGEPLISREISGSQYDPTPEERRRFRSGQSLHWYVEARGRSTGGTSPAARFRVR